VPPSIDCAHVVAARGTRRALDIAKGDPLVGDELGDLHIGINPSSTWPANDLRSVVPLPCPRVRVISITPWRHILSFSASARKAKTSPTGRAMVIVRDSSGIHFSLSTRAASFFIPSPHPER
jgi:hypothetical protein